MVYVMRCLRRKQKKNEKKNELDRLYKHLIMQHKGKWNIRKYKLL